MLMAWTFQNSYHEEVTRGQKFPKKVNRNKLPKYCESLLNWRVWRNVFAQVIKEVTRGH